MTHSKLKKPSKLEYFQLSREYHARGLIYGDYRKLLWYWSQYEKIMKFGEFNESNIKKLQKDPSATQEKKNANI